LKLLKLNLGKLYTGEAAAYIPDPWLVALKAAVNWSDFSYHLHNNRRVKLLPGCSVLDSDDEDSASFCIPESQIDRILQEKKNREEREKEGMCLEFHITDGHDDGSVSTFGDKEAV